MRKRRKALILLLAMAAVACHSWGVLASEAPSLAWRGVIFRISHGTKIGEFREGLLSVRPLHWESDLIDPREFGPVAIKTLEAKGYKVSGGEGVLFDDQSAKARFQLGCIITSLTYNAQSSLLSKNSTAVIDAEWQLYDTLQNKVVLKHLNKGEDKQSELTFRTILGAFTNALERLLETAEFQNAVGNTKQGDENATKWESVIGIGRPRETAPVSLPEDIERVFAGVVTLRIGATIASGVIVSEDGYILTAEHVISGVKEAQVSFKSGLSLPAQVVRSDGFQDLALLKLPGSGYTAIPMAVNETPAVGSDVYAVGTPASEHLALSLSRGIVSGLRVLEGFSYVQTDASLSPGYSGGPLLNKKGQIIGIISWKIAAPGFEGLSFGVPIQAIEKWLGVKWN